MEDKPKDTFISNLPMMLIWWVGIFSIVYMMTSGSIEELPYSEFQEKLKQGKIEEVTVKPNEIVGSFKKEGEKKAVAFKTYPVNEELVKELAGTGIKYKAVPKDEFWGGFMNIVLPLIIFFIVINIMASRASGDGGLGGGLLSVGKSRARVYMEKEIKVTFNDVAGVDEAKEELKEIVTFLKEPERYQKLGGRLPKGVLLVGPPGTGKTLLARAVAGEAGVPFFSMSGSEFVELFVGVGAARVRDLFEKAKKNAPCIIFIDELDALGRARGAGPVTGGQDEKEQTLNQLLSELDGFDSTVGVILISATNRPEILDPALLRAGRFDRQVLVDRPDRKGRIAILEIHMKSVRVKENIKVEDIAAMTPGFTGADLANLVNEATLLAARHGAEQVSMDDFNNAIERIIAGLEKKNRLLNENERRVVAFHEMGHALVALALPGTEQVQKVSIIPRGIGALGYTLQKPTEDRFLMSKQELKNKMAVLMGGRASEKLIFDEISTGAQDDFVKATNIARNMVTRYGMADSLGMIAYEQENTIFLEELQNTGRSAHFSEETAREIDCAVKALVGEAFERATEILENERDVLRRGAEELLSKETLKEEDLKALF